MTFVLTLQHIHLKQHISIISDTYIFQNKSQFTLMLLFLDLGSIFYMDSWVTHVTFREHNNQNKHNVIAYINCKTTLFTPMTECNKVVSDIFGKFKFLMK